jgi:hypothetical protein
LHGTYLTPERVHAPYYSNTLAITDRSNESRDEKSKDANGCRPNVSAEVAVIDVDRDDIGNNEFNVS